MIENRPWLTIFSHTMLILGIAVILFPLYVAFVAATLDKQEVYAFSYWKAGIAEDDSAKVRRKELVESEEN